MLTIAHPIDFKEAYKESSFKSVGVENIKLFPLNNFASNKDNQFIISHWNYFRLIEDNLPKEGILFYYNFQTNSIIISNNYSSNEKDIFNIDLYKDENYKIDLSNFIIKEIDKPSFTLSDLYVNQFYNRFLDISGIVNDDNLLDLWFKIEDVNLLKANNITRTYEVSYKKGTGITPDFWEKDLYSLYFQDPSRKYNSKDNITSLRSFLFEEKGSLKSSRTLIQECELFYALLFHYYKI